MNEVISEMSYGVHRRDVSAFDATVMTQGMGALPKSGNTVRVDAMIDEREPVFTEHEIALLYRAKCADLKINMYPVQFIRFRDSMNKICVNRKCQLSDMCLGPKIIHQLRDFVNMDKIAVLNLAKNNIGDQGVYFLMQSVRQNRSLVHLNLASNEISGKGMEVIFDAFRTNESVISLNLSTMEGAHRNRMTKVAAKKMRYMLVVNKFLETLNLRGVNLGDAGMTQLSKAFCQGLGENAGQR